MPCAIAIQLRSLFGDFPANFPNRQIKTLAKFHAMRYAVPCNTMLTFTCVSSHAVHNNMVISKKRCSPWLLLKLYKLYTHPLCQSYIGCRIINTYVHILASLRLVILHSYTEQSHAQNSTVHKERNRKKKKAKQDIPTSAYHNIQSFYVINSLNGYKKLLN